MFGKTVNRDQAVDRDHGFHPKFGQVRVQQGGVEGVILGDENCPAVELVFEEGDPFFAAAARLLDEFGLCHMAEFNRDTERGAFARCRLSDGHIAPIKRARSREIANPRPVPLTARFCALAT